MATAFEHTQNFPTDPAALFSLLSRADFIEAKCAATGSMKTEVETSGLTLKNIRVLPADLPAAAKSLVGETITVTETQVWSDPAPDGSRTASVSVEFSGPMSFSGTLTLAPAADGTSSITTTGAFKATVPFIGGKIEQVAAEQTARYLGAEEKIAREWLSNA